MPSPRSERVNAFSIFAALAGLAGFVLAALAVVVVTVGDDDGGGGGTAAAAEMQHVAVGLREFAIDMPTEVPAGAMLDVTNNGSAVHNLAVKDTNLATPDLNAGETAMLDISSLPPGDYTVYCTIAGHEAAGMVLDITISESATVQTGGSSETAGGDHASHGSEMSEEDANRLNDLMMASMLEFPAETEGVGNQKLEPVSIDPDGTKVFELEASIIEWEVEPGKVVEAWAYNGQVPAPWIDLEVGDNVRFLVTNNTPLGTDVHWHGITVPNEQDGVAPYTQELIENGETYTYEFQVVEEMVGMYHAHAHSQVSVPNGMFGVFTVGDVDLPTGRTINDVTIPEDIEISQELPMVLNDAGVIGYSLNGKSFPATAPIVVDQGDWVLIHYLNEGLQVHPMHLHGFRQLVVAKDGMPLAEPYWMDTLSVAPGERYTVLVQATEPGTWVYHCHILTHVEQEERMFGMVTAMVVNPA